MAKKVNQNDLRQMMAKMKTEKENLYYGVGVPPPPRPLELFAP